MSRVRVRRALLAWYRREKRDLAWRRTSDPYRIWVSETMLQQTRVEVVEPYYQRFLAAFPTLADLAAAPTDEVLARWAGLGYYQRARSLHHAVRECVERYDSLVPRDPGAFGRLKGIGPYTQAAVLSIAFKQPLAVVDGNVIRVLARLHALDGHAKSPALKRQVTKLADELLARSRPGEFNQAVMELGATVCTPRTPRCGDCPIARDCRGLASGEPTRWPEAAPRAVVRTVDWRVALVESAGRVLIARRGDVGRWRGMWELPWTAGDAAELGRDHCLVLRVGELLGQVRHSVLDQRITAVVNRATMTGPLPHNCAWAARADLDGYALASVWKKVLRLADRS